LLTPDDHKRIKAARKLQNDLSLIFHDPTTLEVEGSGNALSSA
jgi:hypothetical protein